VKVDVDGSRLATAEKRTPRSSSCSSRNLGLAAYSSALENVPGDRKSSSIGVKVSEIRASNNGVGSSIFPFNVLKSGDLG
jgi:hypothetical protein